MGLQVMQATSASWRLDAANGATDSANLLVYMAECTYVFHLLLLLSQ